MYYFALIKKIIVFSVIMNTVFTQGKTGIWWA